MGETSSKKGIDLSGFLPWYVVQTKPANDYRVQTNFINRGIKVLLADHESYRYASYSLIQKIKLSFQTVSLRGLISTPTIRRSNGRASGRSIPVSK